MAVTLSVDIDSKPENPYIITLKKTSDGNVSICATSRDSRDDWYLLRINADGTFYRYNGIEDGCGFSVNTKGQLVESKKE
jgi:hypothetical protein